MRISDWSSDVCSSDLQHAEPAGAAMAAAEILQGPEIQHHGGCHAEADEIRQRVELGTEFRGAFQQPGDAAVQHVEQRGDGNRDRSEEHTSELQSLMRSSYAVFCLKKKKNNYDNTMKITI